ncbi:MAG: hypothetical protein JSW52_11925 [Candidatus Coatesbacteria bacterium]|nr:MAG: hypothetical protein JSW52_11925 [Candidatus Coatesbacteria bacterium]
MNRLALIAVALTTLNAGARTLVTELPDLDGDGAAEKAYAIEWPEPPAPITAERRLTITTEVGGTVYEPYVIDFENINLKRTDTVQAFTVQELTPGLVVIYVVYRRMLGSSAGWDDVALMLTPRGGRLERIWEEVVANWSELHGGFDTEVRFDDVNDDGVPEITTWGVGTIDVGEDDEGERVYEDYTIEKKIYYYDENEGVYVVE